MAVFEPPVDQLDDIDALFADDATLDDLLEADDEPTRPGGAADQITERSNEANLGIDDEVVLQNQRRRVVKLDEAKLTSSAGISKLKKAAQSRLKFRGKGHEFSDIAQLLHMYQLWLDDLYPRAKFADGLAMIETLGHTKNVQRLRLGWVEESKRRALENEDEQSETISAPAETDVQNQEDSIQKEDEMVQIVPQDGGSEEPNQPEPTNREMDIPDDDELDQLLDAEPNESSRVPGELVVAAALSGQAKPADDFGDEEDVMKELGLW